METTSVAPGMSREAPENVPPGDDSGDPIEAADPPPDWLIRFVNPVLGWLLRSPLHWLASDRLALLTVTGRRTGTEYTFPVGYECEDGTVHVTSFGTTWWRNLRDGGQDATVHLAGEHRTGRAEVTEDDQAVAEYVHGYLQRHGTDAAGQVGLTLPDGEVPSVEALESAVDHVVLVTVELRDS